MRPYVSVIIPAYNRANCIAKTIESVRSQTHEKPREIIVVDDGSTDKTLEVLSELQRKEGSPLRVIAHESNKGVSAARNTGIEAAQGNYIAFLDSDDLWHPKKLFRQFAALLTARASKKSDVFCLSYYAERTKDGRIKIPEKFAERNKHGDCVNYRKYSNSELERGAITWTLWFGIASTLLAHRKAIEENGLFNVTMGCNEDTEYVVRHVLRNQKKTIKVVPYPLMSYLLPERGKPYPGQDRHYQYMVDTYRCRIAVDPRFGEDVAIDFVDQFRRDDVNRNHPNEWWMKSVITLLPAAPTAPCQKDGFNCRLMNKRCSEAAPG